MWACCDDTSSDDDVYNTSNAFLLLCRRPHRACAACGAHGLGRAQGRLGLQVWTCSPSSSRTVLSLIRSATLGPWFGVNLPGLSLQHGWTCTRLGLVLLLSGTLVKDCLGLTCLLSSVAPAELPPHTFTSFLSCATPVQCAPSVGSCAVFLI